ncbi:MAG: PASTA domain-containing protein, partial [Bacteroidota bacterium]
TVGESTQTIYHPEDLLALLDATAEPDGAPQSIVTLTANQSEQDVIIESFIAGQEFSCIVLRTEEGGVVALPPTEMTKGGEVFDYRSNLSRKETPINLPDAAIEAIRRECEKLFQELGFHVYAQIDGFYTPAGTVCLNDLNTTSAMLPSSFFFHQAAEIGLNPSQFLTYILRISLQERLTQRAGNSVWQRQLQQLDTQIAQLQTPVDERRRIAVILGGYSSERHRSVESGRNIFEKLSSSVDYEPLPIFLTGKDGAHKLYQLPINLLLKDDADDIRDKITHWKAHPLLAKIRTECSAIRQKYASANVLFAPEALNYDGLAKRVDGVFIALHGRPGEDGQVQMELEARSLPYNGSGIKSSNITIDKYRTLQLLGERGLPVTEQLLLPKAEYTADPEAFFQKVEKRLTYPLVAKPVDDGGSSAVKVIRHREQLQAYTELLFRTNPEREADQRRILRLQPKEEFSHKSEILFEHLVRQESGIHFLKITGGMLTSYSDSGQQVQFEIFEPSEALTGGEVLSLEEKFLVGEGQNLTPARFAVGDYSYEYILGQVQNTLERAAKIAKVEGYCRIDAFVRVLADGTAETQVIAINSLPDMTPATAIFHQAALAGYQPAAFIQHILEFGFQRQAKKQPVLATPPPAEADASPQKTPDAAPAPATIVAEAASDRLPTAPPVVAAAATTVAAAHTATADTAAPVTVTDDAPDHRLEGLRYFLKNLGAMLGILAILFFLLTSFLNIYTKHGKDIQVENYIDLMADEATRKAKDRGFKVSVQKAQYDDKIPVGQVISQDPEALSRAKKNRTIYLTINGERGEVRLPTSESSADDYGLYRTNLVPLQVKTTVRETIFDSKLMDSTILHFYYQGKKYTTEDLKRGVFVMQGSTLEFVITTEKDKTVSLPALRCKPLSEVRFMLPGMDLELGDVIGERGANTYVYRQEPAYRPGARVNRGSTVTVYIQQGRPSGCPAEVETNEPPSDTGGLSAEDTYPEVPQPVDTTSQQ